MTDDDALLEQGLGEATRRANAQGRQASVTDVVQAMRKLPEPAGGM